MHWRIVPVLAVLWWWPVPVAAQDVGDPPLTDTQSTRPHRRARGPASGRGVDDLVRRLFRAAPEDQGPLQPGEAEELLAFAEQHAPRVCRLMTELRQHDPQRFEEKMAAHAPRLRHLRRIYERSPRLGAIVQAYAEDILEIERAARGVRRGAPDSPDRQRDLRALRDLVAENVQRESDALDLMADEIEAQRAERIETRVAYLTSPQADLTAEPQRLRTLVAAFQSAATDAERAVQRDKLQAAAAREVTAEVDALRQRAARIRENAAEEVNRRVQQLLQSPGRHGQRHGPGPSGPEAPARGD